MVKVPTAQTLLEPGIRATSESELAIRVEDVLLHLSFTWQRCGWLLWRGGHAEELVKLRAGVGAGIHAPLVAVPMLGECLKGAAGRMGIPHGPDIIGGDSGHCQEFVILRGDVGALDDLPRVAVPVLDQGLKSSIGEAAISHGPHIVGGDGRDSIEGAKEQIGVGAGDDAPLHAAPVLDQRLLDPLALMKSPTAQTSLAEKLATPLRSLTDGPGLGPEMTHQAAARATAGARNRAISSAATTYKNRLTFKCFMMFLTNSCSLP